jgi:hypothetical protein
MKYWLDTEFIARPLFPGLRPGRVRVAFRRPRGVPFHFPQLCLDIKQWAIELGDPGLPHQKGSRHHALADARWTKEAWAFLASLHPAGADRRTTARKNPGQAGA